MNLASVLSASGSPLVIVMPGAAAATTAAISEGTAGAAGADEAAAGGGVVSVAGGEQAAPANARAVSVHTTLVMTSALLRHRGFHAALHLLV
jgi:hypothetical protein